MLNGYDHVCALRKVGTRAVLVLPYLSGEWRKIVQTYVQLLVEEVFCQCNVYHAEAVSVSLQGVSLRHSARVYAHLHVPRQGLLQPYECRCLPGVLLLAELVGTHVAVIEATVKEYACIGRQGIVYERVEVGPSAAHNVAVGGVQYAVGVHERILLYLVVGKCFAQSKVYHELRSKGIEHKIDLVALFHVEVWIAVSEHCRRRTVDVRVEERNSGTRYAHVVVHADIHRSSDVVSEACRRNQIAIVLLEVIALSKYEFHVLPCMFVACSSLCTELAQRELILYVRCQYALCVLVVYAVVAVEDLFAVYYVIELRVGSVSSANELGTCIKCLVLRQRRRIVGLERVLRATHL